MAYLLFLSRLTKKYRSPKRSKVEMLTWARDKRAQQGWRGEGGGVEWWKAVARSVKICVTGPYVYKEV